MDDKVLEILFEIVRNDSYSEAIKTAVSYMDEESKEQFLYDYKDYIN